jgi:hypothetical protein
MDAGILLRQFKSKLELERAKSSLRLFAKPAVGRLCYVMPASVRQRNPIGKHWTRLLPTV